MHKTESMYDVCGVLAAGGVGSRMDLGYPKSLLTVADKTLLQYSIESLQLSSIHNISVLYSNFILDSEYQRIIGKFANSCLVLSDSYSSTFQSLINHQPKKCKRIIFCYAHAPRPLEHIKKMLATEASIVASGYKSSSMKNAISSSNGVYIEPPYVIDAELLRSTRCCNWGNFFETNQYKVVGVTGPAEFNTPSEFIHYTQYLLHLDDNLN